MIVFKKAETARDFEDIHALRFRESLRYDPASAKEDEKSPIPDFFPTAYTVHAIARHFDLFPIGTIVMIRGNPQHLTLERTVGAGEPGENLIAELSQPVICGGGLSISCSSESELIRGLLRILWRESRAVGIRYWYMMSGSGTGKLLQDHALPVGRGEHRSEGTYEAHCVVVLQEVEHLLFREKQGRDASSSTYCTRASKSRQNRYAPH